MQKVVLRVVFMGSLFFSLGGCVASLQGDSYSRGETRQIQEVEYGIVIKTNAVVIEGQDTGAGSLPGAIVGGIAGSSIGEGKGQQIVSILGAVGGAVLGSVFEENVTRTQGLELTIKMESGLVLSIVQEVKSIDEFKKGQAVQVIRQGQLARVSPK